MAASEFSPAALLEQRHPSVRDVARYVVLLNPNLPRELSLIAEQFRDLAVFLLENVEDSPELTVALRKLLEGKDAAVRAAL